MGSFNPGAGGPPTNGEGASGGVRPGANHSRCHARPSPDALHPRHPCRPLGLGLPGGGSGGSGGGGGGREGSLREQLRDAPGPHPAVVAATDEQPACACMRCKACGRRCEQRAGRRVRRRGEGSVGLGMRGARRSVRTRAVHRERVHRAAVSPPEGACFPGDLLADPANHHALEIVDPAAHGGHACMHACELQQPHGEATRRWQPQEPAPTVSAQRSRPPPRSPSPLVRLLSFHRGRGNRR
jgi:hypothetical protein